MERQFLFLVIIVMNSLLSSCGTYFEIKSIDRYKEEMSAKTNDSFTSKQVLDTLDMKLTGIAKESGSIGFGVALLNKDEVLFQKGYGLANIELKIPFTEQTVMPIASITKTLAGVSIMKAVELGKLSLDDPINNYLDFNIQNPNHPNKDILIRHLATHTSSLNYTKWYEHSYILAEKAPEYYLKYKGKLRKEWKKRTERYNANVDMAMDEFVKSIYSKGGRWYAEDNYLKEAPGTKFLYCNENAALAALVLEKATGIPYKDFVKQYITTPLDMNQSSWALANYSVEEKGKLYEDGNPIPDYHLITYPDGGFITSLSDFTTYFHNIIKGHYGESNILTPESYKTMTRVHFSDKDQGTGVFWEIANGMIGHNGGDPGVNTFAFFEDESSYGYILFFKDGFSMSLINTMIELRKVTAQLILMEDE